MVIKLNDWCDDMGRCRLTEQFIANQQNLDISTWDEIDEASLDSISQETYRKRKEAVILYIKGSMKIKEITEKTGIERHELNRLIKRCLELDPSEMVWGFRALIPRKRIRAYNRTKSMDELTESGYSGMFEQLLERYPDIRKQIEEDFFQREKRTIKERAMKSKYIHKHFIQACREVGLTPNDYPLSTKDLGLRSIQRYIKQLENNHFYESTERYGEEAHRQARISPRIPERLIIKPFEAVQFDGHRIDGIFCITFITPEGDEVTRVLERFWILVIIDVATRDVLGWWISLEREYTAYDVLHCIKNSIIPRNKMEFNIPGLKYPDEGGYASLTVPETKWAIWNEFLIDNGKANLANIVGEASKEIGFKVIPGIVKMPEVRGIIERFFGLLEENGFHRLPNTTGSNPKDPRRKDPEKSAVRYAMSVLELEEIVEVLIAQYNCSPHSSLSYLSPLEVMEQRINKGMMPDYLSEEKRNEFSIVKIRAIRNVVGNIKKGKRPYIQYEGVRYTNEVLSRSPGLIGSKMSLIVNVDDLRTVKAFLEDGSGLGLLTGSGKWSLTPHSLRMRKAINSLKIRKLLYFTDSDDPIQIYKRYLMDKSKQKAKANRFAEVQRASKNETVNAAQTHQNSVKTDEDEEITNSSTGLRRKFFKTITF